MQKVKKFVTRTVIAVLILNVLMTTGLWAVSSQYEGEPSNSSQQLAVIFHTNNDRLREARLAHAIQLYGSGKIQAILTAGGTRALEGQIGADDMALELALRGIPPDALIVEPGSKDTIEGMRRLQDMPAIDAFDIVFISNCLQLPRIHKIHNDTFGSQVSFEGKCIGEQNGLIQIWVDAQYEFAAWSILFLPNQWRTSILDFLR